MGLQTGFENSYRYMNYIRSPEWDAKRKQRMNIDNHICCVCGRPAREVHHLTYDHFENEPMDDLVSLCHDCHQKAEDIYNPAVTPRKFMTSGKNVSSENNFMAVMREDAENISQKVFDYLVKVRGSDFHSLWDLRQPPEDGCKDYWSVLRKAVNALCRKRYESYAEDRKDIAMRMITNHTIVEVTLAVIEHNNRNYIQASLKDSVHNMHEELGTWNEVAKECGISNGTLNKLKNDDGSSFGPTTRESVLYYCGIDAVAGIKPIEGFVCLTEDDYKMLNTIADYMIQATGIEYLGG